MPSNISLNTTIELGKISCHKYSVQAKERRNGGDPFSHLKPKTVKKEEIPRKQLLIVATICQELSLPNGGIYYGHISSYFSHTPGIHTTHTKKMSIFPSFSIISYEFPYIYQPGYFSKMYVLCIKIKKRILYIFLALNPCRRHIDLEI